MTIVMLFLFYFDGKKETSFASCGDMSECHSFLQAVPFDITPTIKDMAYAMSFYKAILKKSGCAQFEY